ncbi:uncharacterized protein FIBRA_01884 [Fibroporia radiculosa]|uniref:Haloacid dehalogenase-like hydrolase domain-containing protein 3 n=1 Tax=Fibroporia radiculosa TaxID=599839 RepID=J4H1I2_9APHY|nr:uncharacterized protein FIBRA_01884 [Fibroporia radiculosa]CCL99859.1 predicted protein [Fibroporia radiculosa]
MPVRLVLFDALHTLLTPRLPIYLQYAHTFEPFLGSLDPATLKTSFKSALKQLQAEKPVYESGAREWWAEVIRRTAVGAGADPPTVDRSLPQIVPRLLHRFASREGYMLFPDTLPARAFPVILLSAPRSPPTLRRVSPIVKSLRAAGVFTGVISNTDTRMRAVLDDLDATRHLNIVLLSEEEGIEKPAPEIFLRACTRIGLRPAEALHVGDELKADYYGAQASGLAALLLRRPGAEGEGEMKDADENLSAVEIVSGLADVVDWVHRRNASL